MEELKAWVKDKTASKLCSWDYSIHLRLEKTVGDKVL